MDLLLIDEVADRLHTTVGTIRHWRATKPPGYPVGFRIGKRIVWRSDEIEAFIQARSEAEPVAAPVSP